MPSFVAKTKATTAPSGSNFAVSTPAGAADGDVLLFTIVCESSISITPPSGVTQIGTTQTVADSGQTRSQRVYQGVHDGSTSTWTFTCTLGGSAGGNIVCLAYTDADVDLTELAQATNAAGDTAWDAGPTISSASGRLVVAFHSGWANTATATWDSPWVEREDTEYWGLQTVAERDGDTSVTPDGSWSANSGEMWTVFELVAPYAIDEVLPDADIVTTGWSTAPLWSKVNDASDATVISATAS